MKEERLRCQPYEGCKGTGSHTDYSDSGSGAEVYCDCPAGKELQIKDKAPAPIEGAGWYLALQTQPPPRIRVVAGLLDHPLHVLPRAHLIGRRSGNRKLAGHWEYPGGKVETGETDAQALAREWMEELGMRVQVGESIGSYSFQEGNSLFFDVYLYRVLMPAGWNGVIFPGSAHDQINWMTPEEVLKLDRVALSMHALAREVLRRLEGDIQWKVNRDGQYLG